MSFIRGVVGESRWAPCFVVAAIVAIAFALNDGRVANGESANSDADLMPDPPAQKRAFAAPTNTKLSQSFVTATAALFELGLADPRDCEYREVEIAVGDIWSGDGGVIKVHAWVLPAATSKATNAQRFAVSWNGLIYRTVSLGEKADLQADVKSICTSDEEKRAASKANRRGFSPRFEGAVGESRSASERTLLPIKACLLLRLGETALAERVWSDLNADRQDQGTTKPLIPF